MRFMRGYDIDGIEVVWCVSDFISFRKCRHGKLWLVGSVELMSLVGK